MQNFGPIGEIDTFLLAAGTIDRLPLFKPRPGGAPERFILLRGPEDPSVAYVDDVPAYTTADLLAWPEMQRALEDILSLLMTKMGNDHITPGNIAITLLPAGDIIPWHTDRSAYAAAHSKFILPIASGAQVFNHRGLESLTLAPGGLWYVANVLQSEINLGATRRIQIEIDIERPRQPAG
jgi:hypothetical protein